MVLNDFIELYSIVERERKERYTMINLLKPRPRIGGLRRPQHEYVVLKDMPPETEMELRKVVAEAGGKIVKSKLSPIEQSVVPQARFKVHITGPLNGRAWHGKTELEIRRKFGLWVAPLGVSKTVPKGILIQKAEQTDVRELIALENECFEDESLRSTEDDFARRIEKAEVFKAVNKKTGKIVGAFFSAGKNMSEAVDLYERPSPHIEKPVLFGPHHFFVNLIVHKDYRRKGVGTALMQKGLEIARRQRKTKVFFVAVTPENFSFIESLGYVLYDNPRLMAKQDESKRLYWAPVAIGGDEKANKLYHKQMNEILQRVAKSEHTREDLKQLIEGIEVTRGITRRFKPETRAHLVTKYLIPEALSRFREERRDVTPMLPGLFEEPDHEYRAGIATKIANIVREYYGDVARKERMEKAKKGDTVTQKTEPNLSTPLNMQETLERYGALLGSKWTQEWLAERRAAKTARTVYGRYGAGDGPLH